MHIGNINDGVAIEMGTAHSYGGPQGTRLHSFINAHILRRSKPAPRGSIFAP